MPMPFDASTATCQPLNALYEHHHCSYVTDFESYINITSSVLHGTCKPQGYVNLIAVEGDECIELSYSPDQARALAQVLLTAAADTDAALMRQGTPKAWGVA